MKIILHTDEHFCPYASIIRSRGNKYSTRLEYCIKSLNWIQQLGIDNNCDLEIDLGDLFDGATISAEESAALNEIKWNSIPKYYLCGNHELGSNDLAFSSMHIFGLKNNITVVEEPGVVDFDDFELCFLPYILETNRKSIKDYFKKAKKKRIILSHNDLKGIQMGQFVSETGFDISEIEKSCDLFLNGHLHNGTKITSKIINLGNLTGLNFSEDATQFDHCAYILDTNTLELKKFINPYAFNFYKVDWSKSFYEIDFKPNAILSAKVKEVELEAARDYLAQNPNILECRLTVDRSELSSEGVEIEFTSIDHIDKFKSFILEKLGSTEVVKSELQEIL